MSSKTDTPAETFKRALAHAARSLAETPDLEVVFSGEGPSLVGNRAVLPHPPRDLSGRDAARLRGLADQMALRLAHHDAGAHARLRPQDAQASAAFEAIEQARIESIGANALGGVRENLRAVLEADVEKRGLGRTDDRVQTPTADILALLVRERLTGERPPAAVKGLVDGARGAIEAKAGADLDRLAAATGDQAAFGKIARAILRDLDMGDAADTDSADEDDGEEPEGEQQPQEGEDQDDGGAEGEEPDAAQSDRSDSSEQQGDSADDSTTETAEGEETDADDEATELGEGVRPNRPESKDAGRPEPAYKVFSTASTR